VHEAYAHRTDLFVAPGENAEYPSAGPGAEGERSSFAGDDRVANDIDIPGEQSLDLPQGDAVLEAFRKIAAIPIEAGEFHGQSYAVAYTNAIGGRPVGAGTNACCAVQTALSVMTGLVPVIHAAPVPANPKLFRRLDDVAECACIRPG